MHGGAEGGVETLGHYRPVTGANVAIAQDGTPTLVVDVDTTRLRREQPDTAVRNDEANKANRYAAELMRSLGKDLEIPVEYYTGVDTDNFNAGTFVPADKTKPLQIRVTLNCNTADGTRDVDQAQKIAHQLAEALNKEVSKRSQIAR